MISKNPQVQRNIDLVIFFSTGGVLGAISHDAGLPLYLIFPGLLLFTSAIVALDIFIFPGGVIATIGRWFGATK